jgi:ElaB/YqjD/DUF883 family membrane-anchored ribosome-binding protein
MSKTTDSFKDSVQDQASRLGDDITNRAAQVKDRVADMARTAADAVDDRRSTVADGIDTAASSLRSRAGNLPGGEPVTTAATAAADGLSTTADYMRSHDVALMLSDVTSLVKKNPGTTLLLAAAFGFVVGRTMRND